ncbi:hypothetical protein [Eikenella exigua]|nr:hypothetical protein [Eikenella exigua]
MPQPQVGKRRQQVTEKAKTAFRRTTMEPETCTKPISGSLPQGRD